jgi:Alkylmercury lyase
VDHDVLERVRRAIYGMFASEGKAPSRQQIQDLAAADEARVNAAVAELAAQRHLVLDQSNNIVMAHPFTTVNLGFSVMGERNLWWGGCAWDSFAIPHLVKNEPIVLVATTCPGCRRPLAWTVTRFGPPEGPEVAHFLVPMGKVWNDVIYACSNQRLFCSEGCVQAWLTDTSHAQGYVMDLVMLWRLAAGWYSGRLDSPYQRKDPQSAAAYFRSVALRGPFWGLND